VASTRPASVILAKALPPVDRALLGWTGGRVSGPGLLVGLPTVELRTHGARTGRLRTASLLPVVTGEVFAVLGTNFGGRPTPGWVHNLLARPEAVVVHRGREVAVRARVLTGAERERVLEAAGRQYRGFRHYPRRAGHRLVQVFALDPAGCVT
jgi:deazaflavin-dependent oxidoreductase (nitroreductase family)